MHAFKDQLIRSALLALYTARPGCVLKKPTVPKSTVVESGDEPSEDQPAQIKRQDSIPHHSEYDEEEWVSSFRFTSSYKVYLSLPLAFQECLDTQSSVQPL